MFLKGGQLLELREKLTHGMPQTNAHRVCIHNVIKGRISGKFYVDQWPNYSALVFQCIRPSISSNGDLFCYITSQESSKHALVCLLEGEGLITHGSYQFLYIIENDEKSVAQYVIKNIVDEKYYFEDYTIGEADMYVLKDMPSIEAAIPAGFTLGRLSTEHVDHILSQSEVWISTFTNNRPVSSIRKYIEHCIERLENIAVFSDCDPSIPIAWIMCHAFSGEMGSLYTCKNHRKKGLGFALILQLSQHFFSENDLPFCGIADGNSSSELCKRLGYVTVGRISEIYLNSRPRGAVITNAKL